MIRLQHTTDAPSMREVRRQMNVAFLRVFTVVSGCGLMAWFAIPNLMR